MEERQSRQKELMDLLFTQIKKTNYPDYKDSLKVEVYEPVPERSSELSANKIVPSEITIALEKASQDGSKGLTITSKRD